MVNIKAPTSTAVPRCMYPYGSHLLKCETSTPRRLHESDHKTLDTLHSSTYSTPQKPLPTQGVQIPRYLGTMPRDHA